MLQIQNLTFRIAGRLLFDEATATVPLGAKCGLVGPNGTGKSTLFKLIRGEHSPESGSVSIPAKLKIGGVAQEAPGTEKSLLETVLEADTERLDLMARAETEQDAEKLANIHTRLADIDAYSAEARASSILHGLGFDAAAQQRACAEFSGGWRMRVALAAVLFAEPDLLMLDEPTNYLDLEGTLWLKTYLARYPHTVIIISHDRDLLNACCTSILHLSERKLTLYSGNYDIFARTRAEKMALAVKAKEKQDAKRAHMEAFVNRFKAKASKARQAQSRIKALARMAQTQVPIDESVKPFKFPTPETMPSSPIIRMDNVSVGYGDGPAILKRLNLRIDNDDRIALLGANGNGKSTFAKLLSSRLAERDGDLHRAAKLKIALFAQHQLDDLTPAWSAYEHFRAAYPDEAESKVRARVAATGLSTEKMDTPAQALSGGERARLTLGLTTRDAPHVLILDEPTNHLDIDSRDALMEAVNDYRGAVILISHDRYLVETCAERIWLVEGGDVQPYDGDLDDYAALVLRKRAGNDKAAKPDTKSQKNQRQQQAQTRKNLAPLKAKLTELESFIEKAQVKLEAIDKAFLDPKIAQDGDKVQELARNRADAEAKLEKWEERWLELSEEYEAGMGG
ncbi:MAG: ABC-F family ATP-binding cassette domain-containing protein [Pseudomonadota bacterium]